MNTLKTDFEFNEKDSDGTGVVALVLLTVTFTMGLLAGLLTAAYLS